MTDKALTYFETLRNILKSARNPGLLDDHPWTHSLIVEDLLDTAPQLALASPGQQLISAITRLFRQLQPAVPPRRGKRLDSHWGEFGLLAALYFTPFNHGTPFPTTLIDAWGRIDSAILYFVFGKPPEALRKAEVQKYQLVGDDLEYGSASTLSDWHKKGLQRLTETLLNRERLLARTLAKSSSILQSGKDTLGGSETSDLPKTKSRIKSSKVRRTIWLFLTLCLLLGLGLIGYKVKRVYERGRFVYQDVNQLQELLNAPLGIETLDKAGPILSNSEADVGKFKQEASPFLWLAPKLSWIPIYGYDLASTPALIELAEHMLNAASLSSQAVQPLLKEFDSQESTLNPADLTALLVQAQPRLEAARKELDQALATREGVDTARLSPRLQNLLIKQLDPVLKLSDESLSLAITLPGLLGAGNDGPKTYMLLVENEDELRPTGGFITSIGNLVIYDGQVISLEFENSGEQEDWSKPYPSAPWQLQEYMNSPVLILRDANWFTDFPTTALWVEYLYAYTHSHSVDGIIAFDQHFLVMLLRQLGPLEVEDAPYPITDANVIEYMRRAKVPPSGDAIPEGWYRKEFIKKLADAVLTAITGQHDHNWDGLVKVLSQALTERHLLLQFDDSVAASLIAEHGWDNAVRPSDGDFLMVTDTNIGFNKTNAVVDASLSYGIDLNNIASPSSTLTVTYKNNAKKNVPCIQWNAGQITGEEWYPIDRCYWNYLRIYRQAGVELLESNPHAIPGEWMLSGQGVPARVDDLDEELPGVREFGTLLVVPGGDSLSTSFKFALPSTVLSIQDDHQWHYHLKVQKQPGTLAIPLVIRIHLPTHAVLNSTSIDALLQGHNLLIDTNLKTDVELEVAFTIP